MFRSLPVARRLAALSVVAVGLQVAGCATQPPALPLPDALRAACPLLAGRVEPVAAGLPMGRSLVESAQLVAAAPSATPPAPEHCRVLGRIEPVDPAAEAIEFQLNLPLAWNRKALQY